MLMGKPLVHLVADEADNVVELGCFVVVEPPHTPTEVERSPSDVAGIDRGDVTPDRDIVGLLAKHVLTYRKDIGEAVDDDGVSLIEAPHHLGEPGEVVELGVLSLPHSRPIDRLRDQPVSIEDDRAEAVGDVVLSPIPKIYHGLGIGIDNLGGNSEAQGLCQVVHESGFPTPIGTLHDKHGVVFLLGRGGNKQIICPLINASQSEGDAVILAIGVLAPS